ncbi:MAG: hypothetical protein IPP69_17475 [Flavobacteriales bacterium]|nr:hypothetical protein [Flavobacteriales bacterium]
MPSISLPKGGGAIKGIDEKFSVNAVNGTASFSIPLPFASARGLSPALQLAYNSGQGNGIFGLGWSMGLQSIKRKTDKGLPQYLDHLDSDVFLFSAAEDLVPELLKDMEGTYALNEKDSSDGQHRIRYYRPRIEGLFSKIERWTEIVSGLVKWRIISKDNTTTLYGWSEKSRIADPSDKNRIYEWFPEFIFDDKGNCSTYIYRKEDNVDFNPELSHNKNRCDGIEITYTNLYLVRIYYGNKIPYPHFGFTFPDVNNDAYFFETAFDYGTLRTDEKSNQSDSPDTINSWDFRSDAFF